MVRHKLVRIEIQVAITFNFLFCDWNKKTKQNKKTIAKCKLWGQKKSKLQNVNLELYKKKVKCKLAIARCEFAILREKGLSCAI